MGVLLNRRVFLATVWQPLFAHFGRTVLAVIAIALGVALGLAIFLMTRAATAETARASRSLFGQAEYVVQGTAEGFDETLYPIIAQIPGIALASPVIESRTPVIGHQTSIIIIGRDYLQVSRMQDTSMKNAGVSLPPTLRSRDALALFEAQNIQLSATAATTLGVNVGDAVTIQVGTQPITLSVVGILPSSVYPQDVGLMDIAAAQWRLNKLGYLSRIELNLTAGADSSKVLAAIAGVLPANVTLTTPALESQYVTQLLRPIAINLLGVALVALFTGIFLVYSTQSLAIVRRRREFALLRALGITAREQIASVVWTGGMLGILGAVLGVAFGIGLAHLCLQYIPTAATRLHYVPLEIAAFAALGILASAIGSLAPALAAARIPTAQALKAGNVQEASDRGHLYVAVALWALAIPLLIAPPIFDLPVFGYAAIALILFGAVLSIPTFTRAVLALFPSHSHAVYQLAVAQLRGVAHMTTTSIATMLVSVSLMVAMSIMGASLRASMAQWAEQMFPADLIVQSGFGVTYLDQRGVAAVTAIDGIDRVEPVRSIPLLLSKERVPVTLSARSSDSLLLESSAQRPSPPDAMPIWINRVLADREKLAPDDMLEFQLAGRNVQGAVRGVWRDYFNPNGALIVDYDQYRRLTGDDRVSALFLWIARGVSTDKILHSIRESVGSGAELSILLPGETRARMLRGFDSLFVIIYLLLAVAVVIGLFGIGVNASAQVLARRAEFGVLRHLGVTRGQIGVVLGIEGLILGALGVIAGFAVGSVISVVMILVVTPQSFHWTMDLHVPTTVLIALAIAVPAASALTALWSGRGAMNDDAVRAVKEDW